MPGLYNVRRGAVSLQKGSRYFFRPETGTAPAPSPGTLIASPATFNIPETTAHQTILTTVSVTGQTTGYSYGTWEIVAGGWSKVEIGTTTATSAQARINDADGLGDADEGAKTFTVRTTYSGPTSGTLSVVVNGTVVDTDTPPPSGDVWFSPSLVDATLTDSDLPFVAQGSTTSVTGVANRCYDGRNRVYYSNHPFDYPIQIKPWPTRGAVTGARFIGLQSRTVRWDQHYAGGNGASLRTEISGDIVFEGCWFDNSWDGYRPTGQGGGYPTAKATVRHNYVRHLRDDFVENDWCLECVVDDNLIDGCFVFYSERSGTGTCPSPTKPTTIRRNIVHMQPFPFTSATEANWCNGQIFKLGSNCGGFTIQDNHIWVERPSVAANDLPQKNYDFPSGSGVTYSGNHMYWTGGGGFPGTLPSGWTLHTNTTGWDAARATWLADHGGDSTGDDFPWLNK